MLLKRAQYLPKEKATSVIYTFYHLVEIKDVTAYETVLSIVQSLIKDSGEAGLPLFCSDKACQV